MRIFVVKILPAMLTKTLLRQLANATSYSRGESYFDSDSVRKIKRDGNVFTGKVDGSQRYAISLTLTFTGPEFHCSCPYDYEGLCKHSVAFGLAVLDEYGPTLSLIPAIGAITWFSPTGETAVTTDSWAQVSDEKKLSFLRQLLDKQPELGFQLALFAGVVKPVPVGKSEKTLSADVICSAVHELLTDLRFDENSFDFDQDDWYSEETPDPAPLIGEVLKSYADQFDKALREGRLNDAMTLYMGVYEGTQAATEPAHDEFGSIEDYRETTLFVWQDLLANTLEEMALRVFSADQLRLALQQLADRICAFEELEAGEDPEAEDYIEPLYSYNLKAFEPLLLALVTDEPSAQVMQEAITQHGWQHLGTNYVQLRIADKCNDPALWLKTADQFAEADPDIALQLLNRHRLASSRPVMLSLLHRLARPFPKQFDQFILEHLSPETLGPGSDQNLYLDALRNRCLSLGQLPDYMTLRTYLSQEQRRNFADRLSQSYNVLFRVQVLHAEERSDELLPIVEKMAWQSTRNMDEILALVAQTYPNECMALARKKALDWLEMGKRDRTMYGGIASWVAALHNVPSLRTHAITFAGTLVSANPRLIALRDELRRKGLVR